MAPGAGAERAARRTATVAVPVSLSTSSLVTAADAAAVEHFFAARDVPALKRTVSQSVEKIRCNAGWLQRDGDAVNAWVRARAAST